MKIYVKRMELFNPWGPHYYYERWGAGLGGQDGWCCHFTISDVVGDLMRRKIHYSTSLDHLPETKAKLLEILPPFTCDSKREGELGKYCIEHASELGFEFQIAETVGGYYRPLKPSDLALKLNPERT